MSGENSGPGFVNWYGYKFTSAQKQEVINTVRAAQKFNYRPLNYKGQDFYAAYAVTYARKNKLSKSSTEGEDPTKYLKYWILPILRDEDLREFNSALAAAAVVRQQALKEKADKAREAALASYDNPDVNDSSANYKWNLPPHLWSLPYRPTDAYPLITNPETKKLEGIKDFLPSSGDRALRRGRIRWLWAASNQGFVDVNGKRIDMSTSEDRKFGFQFMWNPEQFGTNTAVNYSSTPDPKDVLASAPGWFPGQQTLTITVRIDRTNDFACFRALRDVTNESDLKSINWKVWYPEKLPQESDSISMETKLYRLLKLGTAADIDYLLKTVNDPKVMINPYGALPTSDAGFLAFNPVEVELGPIAYRGYIVGIGVNHIGFTEDYIPIRSDVTITINMITTAAAVAGDVQANALQGDKDK